MSNKATIEILSFIRDTNLQSYFLSVYELYVKKIKSFSYIIFSSCSVRLMRLFPSSKSPLANNDVSVHGFNNHESREAILNQTITHKVMIYASSVTGQKINSSK